MMRSTPPSTLVSAFGVMLAVSSWPVLAGTDHVHGNAAHHHHRRSDAEHGATPPVDRTIVIEARDVAFDRDEIAVSAGETVRFVVRNAGRLPHDFTIGSVEEQKAHRQEMARMENHSGHDHHVANAIMLAPGETEELIWTFEGNADLEFACNVPGHYEAGMRGSITVVEPVRAATAEA